MNELTNDLVKLISINENPFNEVQRLGQGESGILKTLLLYEEAFNQDITPSDLCDIQQLTSGRVASTLKSLEKKNYINRISDQNDRRRVLIKLTEKGKKLAENIVSKIKSHIQTITDKLGESNLKELIRLLNLINGERQNDAI